MSRTWFLHPSRPTLDGMEDYLRAIVLGITQGLTEFLPVSSSGHLVLASDLLGEEVDSLTFDVGLHLGTTAAVVYSFWRQWTIVAAAALIDLRRHRLALQRWSWSARLGLWLTLGTIPAVIAGLLFRDIIEEDLREPLVVAAMLILVGVFIEVFDRWGPQTRSLRHVTPSRALAIGAAQAVALIPGVSRSGATIGMGRAVGMRRVAAARFSFLLSAPVVLGAAVLKIGDAVNSGEEVRWGPMLLGAVVAAVVGIIVIRGLLRFLEGHSLRVFVGYRIVLGVVIVLAVWAGAL